ncbi:MAG TPA: tetratricopeptide repeat protein [Acidobacteriota bacterium]|nr:tetratricopeptide repeat protein [Acidobacteriota bacterium]
MRRILLTSLLALAAAWDGASSGERLYRLIGTILREDGEPFKNAVPELFLQGAVRPYSARTQAGPDGRFTFKKLPAGTYTLIVEVPRAGGMRKTVEVGPSFADSGGSVFLTVRFDRTERIEKKSLVSAAELGIPDEARTEYRKADDCLSRSDVNGAIKRLKKAIEIAPQFAAAWNHLGTIAYQSRQYPQAEQYFREALKRDPDAYSPLVNLGGALLSQAKIEESLSVNEQAAKLKPDDPLAQSQLGQSYYFSGRLDEAEGHLKLAKKLDPSHYSCPQLVLVEIYARRNQLPSAIAEIEEFLKLHPDSPLVPRMQKALADARARLPGRP